MYRVNLVKITCLSVCSLLIAGSLSAQITLLDVNTNNTLATSWTVNSISPDNDRILIWMVVHENNTIRTEDSVKLGGQHFTKLVQVNTSDGSLNLDLWYMLEAKIQARTDNTVSDHRTGISGGEAESKMVLVYSNVDQTNPFNDFAIDSTTSATLKRPMTVNVDVISGGMVVNLFGDGDNVAVTWNNGFTKTSEVVSVFGTATGLSTGSSSEKLFLTSQTAAVSVDAVPELKRHALIGVSLNPAIPLGPEPPILSTIGSKSIVQNTNLNFSVSASDPNGTTPSFSASPLPAGASFMDN